MAELLHGMEKEQIASQGRNGGNSRQEPVGNLIGLETSAERQPHFRLVLRRLRPASTQPSQDQSKGRGNSPLYPLCRTEPPGGLCCQGLHLLGSLSVLTIKYEDNFGIFINSFYQHEKVFLYSQFAVFFF